MSRGLPFDECRPAPGGRLACSLLVLGAFGCADPAHETECEASPSPDAWSGDETPRFLELWRAGGTVEGQELAMPVAVSPAPDGRVAVVDFQLGLIGIGPEGAWLGPLTRPGDGPGELGLPLAAGYAADGTLSVLDLGNGKVAVLDSAGELVRELRVDPAPLHAAYMSGEISGLAMSAGGDTYIHVQDPRDEEVLEQAIVRIPSDGTAVDTVARSEAPSLGPGAFHHRLAPGWPRLVFAVSFSGRLAYAGHREEYAVEIVAPDGSRATICRTVDPTPLRADEVGPVGDAPDGYAAALDAAPRPPSPAPIGRLLVGREGRLWIELERPGTGDPMGAFIGRPGARFDVFDAAGRYLGELRAPDGAHVMAASADRVWALAYGPFDVPTVVAYRLDRP